MTPHPRIRDSPVGCSRPGATKEIQPMFRRFVFAASFLLVTGVSLGAGPVGGPINMISTDIMVPAAGRGPGAAGSFWVTDLWIRCPGGGDATLEFHSLDSPSAAPLATATVHMNQPVVYLADVIKTAFGMDSGFGNIRIRSTQPATATLRLYSPGGGGSYGFAFMGMPASMSMGSSSMMGGDDAHRMYIQGLLPQPQARVNVMVMNTGSQPIKAAMARSRCSTPMVRRLRPDPWRFVSRSSPTRVTSSTMCSPACTAGSPMTWACKFASR